MLKNTLTVTARTILRYPLYSAINIVGLAVGLAAVIMILLFVRYELSYDRNLQDHERIYRVSRMFHAPNSAVLDLATIAPNAMPLLTSDFHEIEDGTRLLQSNVLFADGDAKIYVPKATFADHNVLQVLKFPLIHGDPQTAFTGPMSLIVTEALAHKFFGTSDVLGQTLTMNMRDMVITGVMADLPENSHFVIDALMPHDILVNRFGQGFMESWGNNSFLTYFRLAEGANIEAVESGMPDFLDRHVGEDAALWNSFVYQPLVDIHLYSGRQSEMKANGSIETVYTLIAISFIVLAIACINFMNLTTARATQRAREIGVRKAIGATRRMLIRQFMSEAIGITLLALIAAIALVELGLPNFNGFMDTEIEFRYLSDPVVMGLLIGVLVVVGTLAGSYPAFVLSAFEPAGVLHASEGRAGSTLRRILVVGQFAVSIVLIIATGVVYMQIQFAKNIPLGYETEQILVVSNPRGQDPEVIYPAFRNEMSGSADIIGVTASSYMPTSALLDGDGYTIKGGENSRPFSFRTLSIDYDFFETYGISMVAGRPLSLAFGSDILRALPENPDEVRGSVVVNESVAHALGFPEAEDAVGQIMLTPSFTDSQNGNSELTIVGVASDVYYSSVHSEIEPLVMLRLPDRFNFYGIRIEKGNLAGTLAMIDQAWARAVPDFPIVRSFLDDRFDQMYLSEERQGQIFTVFASLAILIASLGLFGLASFTAERRVKEIGIRKSLGATVFSVVRLLSTEFTVLVVIANLIAWPLAWYVMRVWLDGFAYRVDISPLLFIAAGGLSIVIALATVGGQAARSARISPALSLRTD